VIPLLAIVLGLRANIALAWLAALVGIALLANPRACYFFFLASVSFYYLPIQMGLFAVNPSDVLLLILALGVLLEFLLRVRTEIWRTPFDILFLGLIAVTYVSMLFAHNLSLCITPAVRILTLFVAFRLTYKLAIEIGVRPILKFYIYQVLVLSLINCWLFLIDGGDRRIFGPAWITFETFSMTALPMAACFMLFASSWSERIRYGIICLVIGIAIFATQSRAPIVAVVLALPVLVIVASGKISSHRRSLSAGRVLILVVPAVCVMALFFAFKETFFAGAFDRIESLLNSIVKAEGTVALRLVLWEGAIKAFLSDPLVGIGIGNYRVIDEVIPEIKAEPVWYYIRGMSPHNVVLQYLAETGIFGALIIIGLAARGLKTSFRAWTPTMSRRDNQVSAAVFVGMFVFFVTIFYMRAWTWGLDSYIMAMLFGLTAAWSSRSEDNAPRRQAPLNQAISE
jgi:O-antigen ligase